MASVGRLVRGTLVSAARRTALQQSRRGMAEKAPPSTCPGANIFEGGDDPELKSNEEYPEWLWSLTGKAKKSKEYDPMDQYHWRKRGKEVCKADNTLREQGAR